jgi:hypothetical protein
LLGYEIWIASSDRRTRRPSASDRRRRRSRNGTVVLHVPAAVVKAKSTLYLSRGKLACQNRMIREANYNIIGRFAAEPVMSSDSTGCAGSWKPPCSRPWRVHNIPVHHVRQLAGLSRPKQPQPD